MKINYLKSSGKRHFLLTVLAVLFSFHLSAQRLVVPFNSDWSCTVSNTAGVTTTSVVTLPHTWNIDDTEKGIEYYRGEGIYAKQFQANPDWKGKRIFIRFDGVMTLAKVYLNDELVGEHRGGYSAFIFELTDLIKYDTENTIKVIANNKYDENILPLAGDFNIYGGIYRPVKLIVTNPVCISPLDYASPGVYIKQTNVSEESADIGVDVFISKLQENNPSADLEISILDRNNKVVETKTSTVQLSGETTKYTESFSVEKPHLWNGTKDAYLYRVQVKLLSNNKPVDEITEPLGIRFFEIKPNEGFFLNGKSYPLHGVSRHQDFEGVGNALLYKHHKTDMDLMKEMGITALRLAHYQHSETIYDLCDTSGVVVWAEIPWIGMPAMFGGNDGYNKTEAFHNNAKQQLYELIRQNYNHPSIVFWSIFNEIQNNKDNRPQELIHELNNICKTEDSQRITVGASMLRPEEDIHDITDAIAWNKYFGWYYGKPSKMGTFLDKTHKEYPNLSIGISEFGAGGAISQHSQKLKYPNPFGAPHPEEFQSFYHEELYKVFKERPYVWGYFIWNMFDFGSYFRREGEHYGINDKGLVTFDRKTKKDAFYFYKANWSEEPVLHITSQRAVFRDKKKTSVKVYTNLNKVTLKVNGKEMGTKEPVNGTIVWENIELNKGNNGIVVTGKVEGKEYTDYCTWTIDTSYAKTAAKIFSIVNLFR